MKIANLCVVSSAMLVVFGLSACTTVDLSQVTVRQAQTATEQVEQNVVERASYSLTSMFKKNGWCDIDPDAKTKTATNVLLNGIHKEERQTESLEVSPISIAQLDADLILATSQIVQTTKAAEVFLTMSDDMYKLDTELSQLETALLSATQAEVQFGNSLKTAENDITRSRYQTLVLSVEGLKNITDAYGERIRGQIAARASSERS